MPIVWRLIKARYAASAFDGEGARRYGARWNSPGVAVAYAADSPALAVLEVLVHLQRSATLAAYVLASADIPDDVIEALPVRELPTNWRRSPSPPEAQRVGDAWVAAGRSVALEVPSAVLPEAAVVLGRIYLLNPARPSFARLTRLPIIPFSFDDRLIGS